MYNRTNMTPLIGEIQLHLKISFALTNSSHNEKAMNALRPIMTPLIGEIQGHLKISSALTNSSLNEKALNAL